MYRDAVKSLARHISRCILLDDENISFDASLVIYWVWLHTQPHHRTNHNVVFLTDYFNNLTLASSNNTLPDDGDWTETCRSCFNVNFNIPLEQLYCASVGKWKTLMVLGRDCWYYKVTVSVQVSWRDAMYVCIPPKYLISMYESRHVTITAI